MICDLAETYHIYNYEDLPPYKVAVLVFGLKDNSRTKMKLSGQVLTVEQSLLAMILDELRFQSWTYSKDAHKGGSYKGKSVYKTLCGENEEDNSKSIGKNDLVSFATVEEYEAYVQDLRNKKCQKQ